MSYVHIFLTNLIDHVLLFKVQGLKKTH